MALDVMTILGDAAAVAANPVAGLVKIGIDAAPTVADWLFGDSTGDAVQKVADTVKAVTGTSDPAAAAAALKDNAEMASKLQLQLAQNAAAAKQQSHDEEMQRMQDNLQLTIGQMQDQANARSTFGSNPAVLDLAKKTLTFCLAAAVACIILCFCVLSGVIHVDPANVGMISAVFGFLGTVFGMISGIAMTIITFFFGSSSQAEAHNSAMTHAMVNFGNAVTPPPAAVSPPAPGRQISAHSTR